MGNAFNETKAPLLAPRWTRVGYSGKLKDAVINACQSDEHRSDEYQSEEHQPDNQHQQHSMELLETDNDKHEEEEGEKEEVEVTVLLTSNDRQISDDDKYLEMDDE